MASRLATSLCGIPLKTPVLAASGTFAYGLELRGLVDLSALGGIVVKGLSREPMDGNLPPRVWETQAGMINSIGLQNIGVRAFVKDKLPELRTAGTAVFANVFGYAVEDYIEVIRAVRPIAKRPLIVKLSPNVARIEPLAKAAEESGADALSLVNTFVSLAIDPRTRKSRLGAGFGGLSGPAIKPIALRMVYEAARAVKIPVIGLGGIAQGLDAAEFLIAGASAVEVGTANFWDPTAPLRIARELEQFLEQEGIEHVSELVGTLKL